MTPQENTGRDPASFRDPSGYLFRYQGRLYRYVAPAYEQHYERLVGSGFYRSAVEAGLLLPHEEVDPAAIPAAAGACKVLLPRPIRFISYPYEWCFGQLKEAALLTLELQRRAIEHGLWLKDASAYNVQFDRGGPVFIDTLSFEIYPEGRPWVAYQQFCKHFLGPLCLMAYRHVDLGKLLRPFLDGMPLEITSRLLPLRTRLSLGLLAHIHLHARAIQRHAARIPRAVAAGQVSRAALCGLVDNLSSVIRRLDWQPVATEWGDYYSATNYSPTALEAKKTIVSAYIDDARPETIWDLGANTGVFSRLASGKGIPTVAFDVDPGAVEKNYRLCRREGERNMLPLVMDLANPSPSLGWNSSERRSLRERGPVDLVMALALVHHLAIGNNVPFEQIAQFFHGICRSLVIEFVPKEDTQVQRLLRSREDIFPSYHRAAFEDAFSKLFTARKIAKVDDAVRTLYLYERKPG